MSLLCRIGVHRDWVSKCAINEERDGQRRLHAARRCACGHIEVVRSLPWISAQSRGVARKQRRQFERSA